MMEQDDLTRSIAARLRAERESRGWSLSDLAARSAVSRAMIHKIERGDSSPTAQLLARLSGAFGLSMSTLLARAEAAAGQVARRADQPTWTDPDTGYLRRQVPPPSELPLDLVEVTLPPGKAVPMPAAAFAFQRQLIWVLDGALTFEEGALTHRLAAGDCLRLGAPAPCCFRNDGADPCRYAVIVLRGAA